MRDIRAQIAGEVDSVADADGMTDYKVHRMGRAILYATDCALIALICMVVYLAGVGTVPAHAAVLASAAFVFVMWYNHHEAKKNGTIAK
jgi:hypothetical protein